MSKLNYKLVENDKELNKALDIRKRVFVEEQGVSETLEQDGNDSSALHIIVTNGDITVGTVRIRFLNNQQAKLERMAVLKPSRGAGIGKGIIAFLKEDLRKRGIEQIVLHAQYYATGFYVKCGFIETGLPFLEANIQHIRMEQTI
ncbi:GNAT family N-acetyltransferase [Chloroflexota bacterium]